MRKLLSLDLSISRKPRKKNAENLLIIRSKDLAAIYKENWLLHQAHSK